MAGVFLSKSWTGCLEFEADFVHIYTTARSTLGSHKKSPVSVQCRGKTTYWCYVVHWVRVGVRFRGLGL